jgi:DNA-directed RNA polymerase specialized sigma24 family protein
MSQMNGLEEMAINTTYSDCVNLLRDTVWGFVRRNQIKPHEFEEMMAEANMLFMKAYRSYEPNNGTQFSTWLCIIVWDGLFQTVRRQFRWYKNCRQSRPMPKKQDGQEHIDLMDEMSQDAKQLFLLFKETPEDLLQLIGGRKPRKVLFEHLNSEGWSRKQIQTAWRDLREIFTCQN